MVLKPKTSIGFKLSIITILLLLGYCSKIFCQSNKLYVGPGVNLKLGVHEDNLVDKAFYFNVLLDFSVLKKFQSKTINEKLFRKNSTLINPVYFGVGSRFNMEYSFNKSSDFKLTTLRLSFIPISRVYLYKGIFADLGYSINYYNNWYLDIPGNNSILLPSEKSISSNFTFGAGISIILINSVAIEPIIIFEKTKQNIVMVDPADNNTIRLIIGIKYIIDQ